MAERGGACLVVLVGVPGSGKTTFVRNLSSFLQQSSDIRVAHVCVDELVTPADQKRFAEAAGGGRSLWKESRMRAVATRVDGFLSARRDAGQVLAVVVDDNNYYASMRRGYHKMARDHSAGFCQLYFGMERVEDALERNGRRPEEERVPEDVVRRMWSKMEPPRPLVNDWESFSFNVVSGNMEMCASVILSASGNPVTRKTPPDGETPEARRESKLTTDRSVLHQADKIVRRLLGQQMKEEMRKENPAADVAAFGQKLNELRSQLLSDLKARKATLPYGSESSAALEEAVSQMFALKLQEKQ